MASYTAVATRVTTNGPFCYLIAKDNAGVKDVNNVASLAAVFDGLKADLAPMVAGETVTRVQLQIVTTA